jgi:hypothetical protein
MTLKYTLITSTKETPGTNKRYSKCGYACWLKHLKSLHTFTDKSVQVVLADS